MNEFETFRFQKNYLITEFSKNENFNMKSGIKKMARERKEKKLIINHLVARPMPLMKIKTHAFDFFKIVEFLECLN